MHCNYVTGARLKKSKRMGFPDKWKARKYKSWWSRKTWQQNSVCTNEYMPSCSARRQRRPLFWSWRHHGKTKFKHGVIFYGFI